MLEGHNIQTEMDKVFDNLMKECKQATANGRLSEKMKRCLEKHTMDVRKLIVSKIADGCAPLFIACKNGSMEIMEYLITVCNADIEQRGRYEVPDDLPVHCVTPLWCAAACGHLSVVKRLIFYGAEVNSLSNSGSTPVRSACFKTHIDVVIYLVKHGADIHKPNCSGGTCLINSVQSVELCKFLLEHGANVNATDIQYKTALHYAVQEHNLETTKLLLEYNADPHLRSRYNDDALQTACLKAATEIFDYLAEKVPYSPERLADAYELMGSTCLDENNNKEKALKYWSRAIDIRQAAGTHGVPLPKRPVLSNGDICVNAKEFTTLEELSAIERNLNALRLQSTLICGRILGPHHRDTSFRFCDVVTIFKQHSHQFKAQELFEQTSYERPLKQLIDLICRLVEIGRSDDQKARTKKLVRRLIKKNPTSACTGDTLLHLCVSKLNTRIFPHLQVVRLLLECGSNVNAINKRRQTPLHVASEPYNFENSLVKLLLDYGAHLDASDKSGKTPIKQISSNPMNNVNLIRYVSLQCYAAQAISKYGIPYKLHVDVPIALYQFLKSHKS